MGYFLSVLRLNSSQFACFTCSRQICALCAVNTNWIFCASYEVWILKNLWTLFVAHTFAPLSSSQRHLAALLGALVGNNGNTQLRAALPAEPALMWDFWGTQFQLDWGRAKGSLCSQKLMIFLDNFQTAPDPPGPNCPPWKSGQLGPRQLGP